MKSSKYTYIIAGLIIFISVLVSKGINTMFNGTEQETVVKGSVVYADHSQAESAAYAYAEALLMAARHSDYIAFVQSTIIDWDTLFTDLITDDSRFSAPESVYADFCSSNVIFDSVPEGYSYFEIETVSVIDYPYTQLHKNINSFSRMLRPFGLSAVRYVPFSYIRTLNSVVLSVEFFDENNEPLATQELDITVVADSESYYAERSYKVLADDFFIEKFITSMYPEEISSAKE